MFFVVIFLRYLALGAALDGISMLLLTVPVLYPTLKALGFDDIWFGVILVIQAELSQLSPPIGLNLFAVQSVARDVDMATISWASLPYAVMLSLLCFVLYFFPELATCCQPRCGASARPSLDARPAASAPPAGSAR